LPETIESLTYIYAANNMGLIFVQIFAVASENLPLQRSAYRPFTVIPGRWFWYQSKARMRLPISPSSYRGHILHCFWDRATCGL